MSYRSETASLEARIAGLEEQQAERQHELERRRVTLARLEAEGWVRHSHSRRWLSWWSLALMVTGFACAAGAEPWFAAMCALMGSILGCASVKNAETRGDGRARFWAGLAAVGSGSLFFVLWALATVAQ